MTRAAIKHSEERLREAMLASDVAALDMLIDDALLFVAPPDGEVFRKEDDLARHRSGAQKLTKIEPHDIIIELHGEDIGVVTTLVDLAGNIHGQAFEGTFRYVRTWRRTEGTWRIIAGAVMAASATPESPTSPTSPMSPTNRETSTA